MRSGSRSVREEVFPFYDAESINFLRNDYIRVFVKKIPEDEESRVRSLKKLQKLEPNIPDNWSYTINLFEVSCEDRSYKIREITQYDARDEIVDRTSIENQPPQYPLPDSVGEDLYKTVCVKKGSKKKGR